MKDKIIQDKRSYIDDHVSSTIGNGYSLGTVSAMLEITEEGLDQLPLDLREGLFKQSGVYPTYARFSEAPVDDFKYHLSRLAVKVDLSKANIGHKEINLTTT